MKASFWMGYLLGVTMTVTGVTVAVYLTGRKL